MLNVATRWSLHVFLALWIALGSTAVVTANEYDDKIPTACSAPASMSGAPHVQAFVRDMCERTAAAMDYRTGVGTKAVPILARELMEELSGNLAAIPDSEWSKTGLTIDILVGFFLYMNNGEKQPLPLMQYSGAVNEVRKRFERTKVKGKSLADIFEVKQAPVAALSEALYEFVARFPSRKVSIKELKQLSDDVYPNLPADLIVAPVAQEYLNSANEKKAEGLSFQGAPEIRSEDDIPLGPLDAALKPHQKAVSIFKSLRYALSMGVAFVGSVAGTAGSIPGYIGGAQTALYEWQFNKYSDKFWAKYWHEKGFWGNVRVNLAYGASYTAMLAAAALVLGLPQTTSLSEFLVKSCAIGTAFTVASFGGLQVGISRALYGGYLSAGKRYIIEFVGSLVNNAARLAALGAAWAGTETDLFSIPMPDFLGSDIAFKSGEIYAWSAQLACLTLVTIPLWIRMNYGDAFVDELTAWEFGAKNDPEHKWNGMFGTVRRWCAVAVAKISKYYTPQRRAAVPN